MAANDAVLNESIEFNGIKSMWLDKKCRELGNYLDPNREAESIVNNVNKTLPEKVWTILCSGPSFTEHESSILTKILYEMQEIFTETQICLPIHFDICLNIDWLFSFTYEQNKDGFIQQLDLSLVTPIGFVIFTIFFA